MKNLKNTLRTTVAVAVAATGLSVAIPAKADVLLVELDHAIVEASCYRSDISTVASVTVTPRDGTDMNFATATFSNFGWDQRTETRIFQDDELPTVSTTYSSSIGGISVQGVFEDVNGYIYSFTGVNVACSEFNTH